MMTGWKSTLSRKARGSQRQTPQPERESHDQHELYRHQHVQEVWQNWTVGKGLLETRWRSVRQLNQQQQQHAEKARVTRIAKGKADTWTSWKRISLLKQHQPCRIFHNNEYNCRTLVQFKRGSVDHGCENQFRVYKETSWCRVFAS